MLLPTVPIVDAGWLLRISAALHALPPKGLVAIGFGPSTASGACVAIILPWSLCARPIMSSSTPSIRISQPQRYPSPPAFPHFPSVGASPMAIPRAQDPVPPPLPPPSYIPDLSAGHDPGWQWGNDPTSSDFGRAASVRPGSSLLGGAAHSFSLRREKEQEACAYSVDDARRGSSVSTITMGREHDMTDDGLSHSDEDRSSSRRASNYRCVYHCIDFDSCRSCRPLCTLFYLKLSHN
jgi:hypothetical protein